MNEEIVHKHKVDFNKAFNQVVFFYHIPLDEGHFNVMKDFNNSELMNIQEMPSDEEASVEPNVEVVVDDQAVEGEEVKSDGQTRVIKQPSKVKLLRGLFCNDLGGRLSNNLLYDTFIIIRPLAT